MWKSNKIGIITLFIGFVLLFIAYAYVQPEDPELASRIMAGGTCILLFTVALGSWLSVRRELNRHREEEEE